MPLDQVSFEKRYEEALSDHARAKIRALSMFIVNFAASVQQYTNSSNIFGGYLLLLEPSLKALIGAVILGGRTMVRSANWQIHSQE